MLPSNHRGPYYIISQNIECEVSAQVKCAHMSTDSQPYYNNMQHQYNENKVSVNLPNILAIVRKSHVTSFFKKS